jgi:hypothetical protein
MMDPKKLSSILKSGPKTEPAEQDTESDDGLEEGLAQDILDSLRSKDAAGLASALRSFVEHCSDGGYDDEDAESED